MLRAFSNVILGRLRNIHNPLYPPYLKGDVEGESPYINGGKKRIPMLRRFPLLKLRGERGVIKERILISRGDVAGDSPNFRGLVKERPLILRWNLSKNTLLHKWM